MGQLKTIAVSLVMGFLLDGCAAHALFSYKYYGLDAVSYDGTLSGPTAQQDESLQVCQPTATDKSPCVVMLSAEFYRLKGDHLNLENEVVACEQNCPAIKAVAR